MKKTIKITIITIVALILISIIATIGIGEYFVKYAIAREGDGGNREVKEEITDVQIDDVSQSIIATNHQEADKEAKEWDETANKKTIEIQAKDAITLRGTEYITNESSHKWAIVLHGYRSTPKSVLTIGQNFAENDYNVLIPSMRACAQSDGEYIGMGWLDKDDLKEWIKNILSKDENAQIVLHGSSMGAATVLMASGDTLPSNVKCIIADSGYTSVWDIFASEAKARFGLPEFPALNMFQIVAKVKAGYDIKEASATEQVKKSITPTLFIHGSADDFVPLSMCETLFENANCVKDKLIIEGAGHTEAKYKEPDTYYNKMFDFINTYMKE